MIKKTLKYLFNKLGLQINRLPNSLSGDDELITAQVGNFNIFLNKKHTLPGHLKQFPHYSTNLPRLTSKVKKKYSNLILIDIGANVGDTVALCRSESYFPIVCIEGDNFYFSVLQKNIKQFKDVQAFQFFLGEKNSVISARAEIDHGTLQIKPPRVGDIKNNISIITLDNFLDLNSGFKSAKLLKIDTDGFDLKIIRGAKEYITKTKPVLFFEYDRTLLEGLNEDGINTLDLLESMGYETAVFYDNFGRFIVSAPLKNTQLITQLHFYIKDKVSAFPFYDICLFHQQDKDIADEFVKEEMFFFKESVI